MSKNIRVRNMRNEYRYSFLWNFAILILMVLAEYLVFPETGPIENRTMLLLYAIDGVVTLLFMYWMEKYNLSI